MRTEFSPAHEVEHQLRALLFPDEGEDDVEGHDIGFFKKVEVRVWNRSRIRRIDPEHTEFQNSSQSSLETIETISTPQSRFFQCNESSFELGRILKSVESSRRKVV